ncbi:hypothetical protein [Acinetobacter nosocomialis]|uniref:hypothetical protein n=1 Tax=Acinetobacter nosocomialis TaxID=106654 RepID=UPI0033A38FB6
MNNFLPFTVSINWLVAFGKFLDGMILGLGFIVAVWIVIKLTSKPKKEPKPHHGVDKFFYVLLGCIVVAIFTFLMHITFFNWVLALFAVSMTFICAILHTEADFCKEQIIALNEKRNASSLDLDFSNIAASGYYTFHVGQTVVYVDDYMPDHTETIELIEDGYAYFNKGSRRCILEMIRPATALEARIGERQE